MNNTNNNIEFYTVFNTVLADIPMRSREIIAKRFGIGEEFPLTLQAIGDEYNITRERVRQIVQSGLRNISNVDGNVAFMNARDVITSYIRNNNGILVIDDLAVLGENNDEYRAIRFLVEGIDEIEYVDNEKYPVKSGAVSLIDFDMNDWNQIHNTVKNILQKKQKTYTSKRLHKELQNSILNHRQLENYLRVSAEIKQNPFEKWGFREWDEISPKGVREKAILILKEKKEPLHFREITRLMDLYGLSKSGKKSHPQTVHNELIRDDKFVLVGRGVYALKTVNHVEGTVKDVIENILENSIEPLTAEEIIERVLKIRQVQSSTVKVNLNAIAKKLNKKYTLDVGVS